MSVHDFDERLRYSHTHSDAPYWEYVYRQAFPDMVTMLDLRHDGWHQRAGRDRAVVLDSGRSIFIDEKVRSEDYGDIAVEVWSTYPLAGGAPYPPHERAAPGWAVKPLDCDFLAYAIEPCRTCYLFPFLGVRAAWSRHGAMWRGKATNKEDGYRWVRAQNRTYATISIAIPLMALQACINDAMTISWAALCPGSGSRTASIPTPRSSRRGMKRSACTSAAVRTPHSISLTGSSPST